MSKVKKFILEKNPKQNIFVYSGEAHQLAVDFRSVCEAEFPAKITADYVTRHYADPNEISTRRNMILAAKQLVHEFSEMLKQDRSPVNISTNNNNTNSHPSSSRHTSNSSLMSQHIVTNLPPTLDPSVQRSLSIFSLITHGFGSPAITAAVDTFHLYLTEMLKNYEKNYPMFIATTSTKADID